MENTTTIDTSTIFSSPTSSAELNDVFLNHFKILHGWFMFFAWGVFSIIGFFIAKFGKSKSWWFNMHVLSNILVVLLTIIGFTIIYYINDIDGDHFMSDVLLEHFHMVGGLIICIILLIQCILGMFINILYKKDRISIPFHDKIHWWIGRCGILLSMFVIYTGLTLVDKETYWNILLITWYSIVILGFIITDTISETKTTTYEAINETTQVTEAVTHY